MNFIKNILNWLGSKGLGLLSRLLPAVIIAAVGFLLIQAIILKFDTSILIPTTTTPLIYPYFFVNLETQGVAGVAKWGILMFVAFMAVGYVFYGVDKLLKRKEN